MAKCCICKKPDATYKHPCQLKYYCGADCGAVLAIKLVKKQRNKEVKKERKQTKKMRDISNQTITYWRAKADPAFQLFCRLRDHKDPCISCGRFEHEIKHSDRGGKWDGGHYLSKGAGGELRYSEDNCHKQCKYCNSGKYMSGNSVRYRPRLINKIGQHRVDILEGPHEQPRWRWYDYKAVYDWYHKLNMIIKKEMS